MKFTKMHGCGNDYIFVNSIVEKITQPERLAKGLSDRHFGIGGDGLILIGDSNVADYSMKMYNADGSVGDMCGNGIRCIGKYVYETHMTNKTTITIETLAGIKTLFLTVKNEQVIEVMVDMGVPILNTKDIPVEGDAGMVINEPITILGKEFFMTCVSMGNPHAVVFIDNVQSFDINKYGLPFEHNLRFPNRTNIEFVQILDRNNIKMRVWERGTGETLACGTGACAAAIAGIINRKLDHTVMVHALGGILKVNYNSVHDIVFLSGPAVKVFDGEFSYKEA